MKRQSLRVSVAANFIGRAYMSVAGIIFVPFYLRFLGIAEYGLFALLNSYMFLAALLDLGLSWAIMRELAKLSSIAPEQMRDVVWTISVPYCAVTALVAIGLYLGSPWIAAAAIHEPGSALDATTVRAVSFGGISLALQLPIYLYSGALAGIQRQDIANGVSIASTTLRHGVGFLLLWLVSNSVVTLMAWQAAIALLTAVVMAIVLWRVLPRSGHRPIFSLALLRDTWRFAASLGAQTVVWITGYTASNALVGAMLPLSDVGHYMLANTISTNLTAISAPIRDAAFPRFAQLAAAQDWSASSVTLARLSELAVLVVVPVAATIAVFPREALFLWTGNAGIAQEAASYVRYLAIGAASSAFTVGPYALLLARGYAGRMTIIVTAVTAVTLPAIYLGTLHFGAIGAATVNGFSSVVFAGAIGILFFVFLPANDRWRWLSSAVVIPQIVTAAVAFCAVTFAPHVETRMDMLGLLAMTSLATVVALGLAMPWTRGQALLNCRKLWTRASPSAFKNLPP